MHQLNLNQRKNKHFVTNAFPSRIPISRIPIPRIDRISSLSDDILLHIMSFLYTKCAARTSVLSKRFNALWWSYPNIDLNEWHHVTHDAIDEADALNTRERFLHHMKLCYMRHDLKVVETLKIVSFEEINASDGNLSAAIDSFVFATIKAGALKEIILRFPTLEKEPPSEDATELNRFYDSFYMVPQIPLFSSCRSLTSLYFRGCSFGEEFGTMVPNLNLPSAREIYIRNCIMPYDFVSKLVNVCPTLEDLTVKYCLGVKVIRCSHSQLKNLSLGCNDSEMVLELNVLNLQTFKFVGASWQSDEVESKDDYTINAPNLETITTRSASVFANSIYMTLARFKNLKEVVLCQCYMEKSPEFWGENIERVVISYCEFGEAGFAFHEPFFPVLRSLRIDSCDGILWLSIESTKLEELVLKRLRDLEAWNIYAPNAPNHSYVNFPN